MQPVRIELLQGNREEMAELQRVLEEAPEYAERITGAPPGAADAQSTYTVLPDGKTYDDKFVFGIFASERMVGCVDLIRGYPASDTACLGLLLVSEQFQHQGIGGAALGLVEKYIQGWPECARLRLAVVRTNEEVIPFFRRHGFEPTGESKPYHYSHVESECVLFEKRLRRS